MIGFDLKFLNVLFITQHMFNFVNVKYAFKKNVHFIVVWYFILYVLALSLLIV